MHNHLRDSRKRIEEDLVGTRKRAYLSPAFYVHYQAVIPLLEQYLHGTVIDLGCGMAPFRHYMPKRVSAYHTLDYVSTLPDLTYRSDLQHMPEVPSAFYDGALCFEVLEHLPRPWEALQEIHRILKPGAVLILTVPHLSRLHDVPYDFYRFTLYGLQTLLHRASFQILALDSKGGLLSFLGHQLSTLLVASVWGVPLLRDIGWVANKWLVTYPCAMADRVFGRIIGARSLFPLGYVVVVRKPSSAAVGVDHA